ncbi:MAG: rhomboid family intramembrane serine protease, partial [Candidatus Verstraetearchaeota archaeon]|nr:rhomboid family intramembrane serine protease [Candidatus Verstraetearchaeota archaeon]
MFPIRDFNRSGSKPIVTWTLIIVNILVFYYQVTSGHYRHLIANYGEIPFSVLPWLMRLSFL